MVYEMAMPRLKAPQRKEQILAVATKIFARMGYNGATTHAIADAAGVTEPILYRHFKGKQELFVAIARQMSRQTIKHWEEMIEDIDNPVDELRVIARGFPRHLRGLADAYHVIHGALATSRDRKVVAVMKEHYSQIEKFFCDIIKRGQESGAFRRDVDCRMPAWQLIHMGIGYAMIALNLSQFDQFSVTEAVEAVIAGIKSKK
jgi:AcrR family transcriptional regulator